MALTVRFEDRDWAFDDDKVTLAQAMVFHQESSGAGGAAKNASQYFRYVPRRASSG